MSVRPASSDDLPALLPLMRGYCDFYEADPPDEGLLEMCRALIAVPDSDGILLVAEHGDGRVAGFAAAGWKWSSLKGARVAIMEDLFVAESARGAGLADALIRACAERAEQHGAAALEWVTAPDNKRAQAVYDRTPAEPETTLGYELAIGGPARSQESGR